MSCQLPRRDQHCRCIRPALPWWVWRLMWWYHVSNGAWLNEPPLPLDWLSLVEKWSPPPVASSWLQALYAVLLTFNSIAKNNTYIIKCVSLKQNAEWTWHICTCRDMLPVNHCKLFLTKGGCEHQVDQSMRIHDEVKLPLSSYIKLQPNRAHMKISMCSRVNVKISHNAIHTSTLIHSSATNNAITSTPYLS